MLRIESTDVCFRVKQIDIGIAADDYLEAFTDIDGFWESIWVGESTHFEVTPC